MIQRSFGAHCHTSFLFWPISNYIEQGLDTIEGNLYISTAHLCICAHIKSDGQTLMWLNAC
jgi:hypothetical protein